MSLEKANKAYKGVLKSAAKFLSPAFKTFFTKKATDDFHCFSKRYLTDNSIAEQYIEKQKDLAAAYNRVAPIYNTYRDSDLLI